MSQIKITVMPDGGFKVNAQKCKGSEAQIKKLLAELADEVGGELTIEKHVHGAHDHHHHHDHDEEHN